LALYLPRRGNTELLPLAFLVLYPVVLLWAVCLALVMSLSMRLAPHRGWLLFILGLCGNTAVWLEWNSRTLDGTLVDGGFYNALFSVAAVTQGAGLYLLRLEVSTAPRVEAFCAGVMRLLPLIIVVLAGLAVLFTHTLPQVPDLMREISVVGAFVVVILASIRQSVLLTERERLMQAEHSLRLQQEAYRVLVEQAADGIFVADRQGRYVEVNKSGADMLGMTREEVLRIGMRDIVATEMNQSLVDEMRALLAGVTVHSRWQLKRKDGSVFDAEITGKMLPDGRLQGLVRDVSERKALEEQLRQAQKMEAIGTLAAGIAHDFNNLLMAIRGYTEIVAEDLGAQHVAQSSLGEIRKASSRAGQKS
jgi:PAS domain S-box-containing protein